MLPPFPIYIIQTCGLGTEATLHLTFPKRSITTTAARNTLLVVTDMPSYMMLILQKSFFTTSSFCFFVSQL